MSNGIDMILEERGDDSYGFILENCLGTGVPGDEIARGVPNY